MKTLTDAIARLDACETAADLASYAADLYASDLLDESEQTTAIDRTRGPIAPWSYPLDAEEISDNGEDCVIRLRSGHTARWENRDREWSEAS